ncbi:beta-1,3-glucan-binding protein-like [Sitodiplosis mosellana]|uniref:beta-1,3-glucan-binding protein-like n=1 Tax=Sitodiplosis mosellana TaxID=263140 RepID=UPI0024445EE8|nr:beta-1,3-glucan-binding protein-like [Sitodiplosis mosellana]
MFRLFVVVLNISVCAHAQDCTPSITTVGGSYAPSEICSGQLILDENFDTLDKQLWQPEVTLEGGGNNEFEWYVADDENSFAENGKLHIKPTLTSHEIGEDDVEHGSVDLKDCTDQNNPEKNCHKQAGGDTIINPIRSARLNTQNSFTFKYGRVEFIAKLPIGDWMWSLLHVCLLK